MLGLRFLHTSIFIKTPSLEELPTKAKENLSPHEMRLPPAGHQPSISWSWGIIIIIIIIIIINIIIIIIIIIIISSSSSLLLRVRFYYLHERQEDYKTY